MAFCAAKLQNWNSGNGMFIIIDFYNHNCWNSQSFEVLFLAHLFPNKLVFV